MGITMNLLFLSIGELTNMEDNSMLPDLLRYLRDKGHRVHVICVGERRTGLPSQIKNDHGIKVLRVKTGNITKTNLIEKGITTLLIGYQFKSAINKFFKDIQFDLILYTTPPITIVNTVRYVKKRDKAFSYLLLKDIFPQNALDIGILKKTGWRGMITKYFLAKEKSLYLHSDFIGCMSEANVKFLKLKHPYLDSNKIEVCPNTRNLSPASVIDRISIKDKFKLPQDKVIFVCGGNFGKPQDVDYILEVMKSNDGMDDRHFVMCGSGSEFYKLKEYAANCKAKQVTVIDSLNNKEFNQLLSVCDVGLIFLDHRFTVPNYPSRILDYMNHSLPILAATDCSTDLGTTIVSNGFGWWCESNNTNSYKRIVDEICSNPLVIEEMGNNGRAFLFNNYTTKIAYEKIMHAFRQNAAYGITNNT